MATLILSRKKSEKVFIGKDVTVTVTRIVGGKVTLTFDAPKEIKVLRSEVKERDAA